MKVLFITHHPYLPQLYGGLQTSTDQLCRGLMEHGHNISVLAGVVKEGFCGWKSLIEMKLSEKFRSHKIARDTRLGYPVWRTWFPQDELEFVAAQEKPDVIVITTGNLVPLARTALSVGLPVVVQLHDVQFHMHAGNLRDLGNIPCIANSRFTARRYHAEYGLNSTVIYPLIKAENYRTTSIKKNVTFINPHPEKGLDLALKVAHACPEIPFSFVLAWPLPAKVKEKLETATARLPNISISGPYSDMRPVYRKCKILLVPSFVEEAYGRVATEAQLSGIPVIASARGGLPEAVGDGGILLDPECPLDEWIVATKKLWVNDFFYADISLRAALHAGRSEIDFYSQIKANENFLQNSILFASSRAPRNS
ncbi:MAG: glycosyltransferase [Bdellovibrionales bacterium]